MDQLDQMDRVDQVDQATVSGKLKLSPGKRQTKVVHGKLKVYHGKAVIGKLKLTTANGKLKLKYLSGLRQR